MSLRQTVEFVLSAVDRRDFDAIERSGVMHPEMEFHSVVARAEGTYFLGVDGLREWAEMADDMWQDFRVEVHEIRLGTDARVLVRLRLTGVSRGSGVPLDQLTAQVWHWRDGLLWRNIAYSDHDEAARAAGL